MKQEEESENLMNAMLPVAERMLGQYGEFYPFGGYLNLEGAVVHVGASDSDTDRPKSKDLIYILRNSFQEMARAKRCRAVVVVFDVAVVPPKSDSKCDAIQACVEHSDGYSAEVFFPYQLIDNEIIYGETFAQQGKHEIFGWRRADEDSRVS
jgi:hypothetical protein